MSAQDFMDVLKSHTASRALMVCLILMTGWLAARFTSRWLSRVAKKHFAIHQVMLIKRMSYYLIVALTVVTALNEAGINLSVVVGAAGVASVAIGFASQTSMSNLISGIFIIIEKPFIVGDTIRIGGTTGEVISMGLLSTILKTPDNVVVRIPNENLMKSEIGNITRFSVRKFDLQIGLQYSANLADVKNILLGAMNSLGVLLKTPAPTVQFDGFTERSMNVTISCWVSQEKLSDAKFEAAQAIKRALEAAKIEVAVPQRFVSFADDAMVAKKV